MDGNTADVATHIDTWDTLRAVAGRPDVLYVADCKLCSRASLAHIAKQGGRFITVLPRNRREDRWFRKFVQVHEPPWEEALRRPNPRRRSGPEDVWKVVESDLPSKEGYRIVWVWNSLMAAEDGNGRQARIEKAWMGIERLQTKLQGKRCRLKLREKVEEAAAKALKDAGAERWVRAEVSERVEPVFRQEKRGHPGPKTRYLRRSKTLFFRRRPRPRRRRRGRRPLRRHVPPHHQLPRPLPPPRSSRRTSSSPSSRSATSSSSPSRTWHPCG